MPGIEQKPGGPLATSVEKLRHEFDNWLEAVVYQGERALDAFGFRGRFPLVDVIETSDAVLVEVDLPGVDPQLVDVLLAGNMLTLRGKRPGRLAAEGETTHLTERGRGEFQRSIPMPAAVDSEQVSAHAENGVLHVRLAKTERALPRQIRVNAPNRSHPEL